MIRLHGGDDARLRESREVNGTQVLRVFDAPAAIFPWSVLPRYFRVDIQHDAVCFVSDCVDGELQSRFVCAQSHPQHIAFRKHHFAWQPRGFRRVGEGLFEQDGCRS